MDDLVMVKTGSRNGELEMLDRESGDRLATHNVGEPMRAAPTVGGDAVYVLAGTSVHAIGE